MGEKDIIEGKIKQAEGKVQDAFGDLTGRSDQDVKGKVKQAEGKVQETYGRVQNAVKDEDVDEDDNVI